MSARPLIAVVDDDAAIRTGVSSLLRSAGYAVELFDSAEDFLERVPEPRPHCMITDIQMPGMSGLELQAILRARHRVLPIMMMTAFPEPAIRERAMAQGAVCFLSKPFNADDLLGCVGRALAEAG